MNSDQEVVNKDVSLCLQVVALVEVFSLEWQALRAEVAVMCWPKVKPLIQRKCFHFRFLMLKWLKMLP